MRAAQQPSMSDGRQRPRAATWVAWSLWAVVAILAVLAMILVVVTRSVPRSPYDQWYLVWVRMAGQLAFPTVGLIIASRRPATRLDGCCCASGSA